MEAYRVKNIRFGAVYGAPPIFCADSNAMGYISPEDLDLPESLVKDIHVWDKEFQKTFCDDYTVALMRSMA